MQINGIRLPKFKVFLISALALLITILCFKDTVFRYLPSLAVVYGNEDILTSRRSFDSGKVWKFRIGHNFYQDISNLEGGGPVCEYKTASMDSFVDYKVFKSTRQDLSEFSLFVECDGILVNKYFKIFVYDGIIVKIELTVSMIGTV